MEYSQVMYNKELRLINIVIFLSLIHIYASGTFCEEEEQSPLCSNVVPLAGLESSNPDPSHDQQLSW